MAWVKVPPQNHGKFQAALPDDPRVTTVKMFGGIAAKAQGRMFAGLFGHSTVLQLPEAERTAVLALPGAVPFDPMGNGRPQGDRVMLPARVMDEPTELRRWIRRAFEAAVRMPEAAKSRSVPKRDKPASVAGTGTPTSIDAYLAAVTGDRRSALEALRRTIRSIVPDAEECISYRMPAFRVDGKVVAGFSATTKGCSYFPFSGSTLRTLAADLGGYEGTKSSLHFDPAQGLPKALVRKLLETRLAESSERRPKPLRSRGGR